MWTWISYMAVPTNATYAAFRKAAQSLPTPLGSTGNPGENICLTDTSTRGDAKCWPGFCALAVMAKAPRPGKVKTRLSPPLTPEQASALNICFIRDTTENIYQVTEAGNSAGIVVYTPVGDEAAFDGILPTAFQLLGQRGDGFGDRLLHACEDLFACGFSAVCLIDSDSPTMPQDALVQAVSSLLRPGDRVVLGGSDDGGYYLIGLKHLHQRLFEQIDWSTERVFKQTLERAREIGLEAELLPTWYDVDDGATLERLRRELLGRLRREPRRIRCQAHQDIPRDPAKNRPAQRATHAERTIPYRPGMADQ